MKRLTEKKYKMTLKQKEMEEQGWRNRETETQKKRKRGGQREEAMFEKWRTLTKILKMSEFSILV